MANATHILTAAIKVTKEASSVFGANIVQQTADGAKAKRVSFSTVVSGATGGAGGDVSGTRMVKSNLNATQGDIYSTADMPGTFVAITNGTGRYCVRAINDDTAPLLFTRKGDFDMQADGTLRNSSGHYLCGINYDVNGQPPAGGVNLQNLKIIRAPSIASTAIPTAGITLNMRLPPSAATGHLATFDSTVVDSLGITHNATFTMTKQATANRWNLTAVSITNGGTVVGGAPNIPIVFNSSGAITSINGTGVAGTAANVPITFDFSVNGATNNQTINIKAGTFGSPSGLTQNGDSTDAILFSVAQDGVQPSDAIGNEISEGGILYTRFAGSSKLSPRGQVPLAVFGNVNGLADDNGTTQVMRVEAGDFTLQIPNKGNGGSLVPKHLEKSTTDSTQEYVHLLDNVNQQSILVAGLRHSLEADRALTTL